MQGLIWAWFTNMIVDDTLDGLLDKMADYVPHKTIFQMKADDL